MTEPNRFGRLLRRHRGEVGLTIEELSAASRVSVRAISDMERGRSRVPQRRTVEALVQALGLPPQLVIYPFVNKRPNGETYFNYGEYLLKFSSADHGMTPAIVHRLDNEQLTCFFEDFWGNQYVGTKAAVYCRKSEGAKWEKINLWVKDVEIKSINKNAHKQLLLATNKGLLVLDETNRKLKHYNSYDYAGMVSDYIYAVLLDDKDNMWISHNRGITHMYASLDMRVSRAIRFGERCWSYRELDDATARVAGALAQWGLRPGDRVAAFGKNSDAYVLLWLACLRSGLRFRAAREALNGTLVISYAVINV